MTDEHLPKRSTWRRPTPGALGLIAVATAIVLVGSLAVAFSARDSDDVSTSSDPTTSSHTKPSATTTTSWPGEVTSLPSTTTSTDDPSSTTRSTNAGATTTAGPNPTSARTSTTLPDVPNTRPPTPSTTGPDTRTPVQAYAQEYEAYCRSAFEIAPDGVLYDPDFVTDSYVIDDCLDWLDPEWGEFYDTADEAAQAGIDDAISALEDFSPMSYALCWIDSNTDEWGGCWYSPNAS